jgi:hypothetical protein
MTPKAWFNRGMHWVAGGPVFGKRGGVTVNLAMKVIAAWEPPRPPVNTPWFTGDKPLLYEATDFGLRMCAQSRVGARSRLDVDCGSGSGSSSGRGSR